MIVKNWKCVDQDSAEPDIAMKISLLILSLLLLLPLLSGCATTSQNKGVLAIVDGEQIARGDLEYALQIAHRRQDLERGYDLDIDRFINKLVDEMLIIQEARRIGMDDTPDINSKVNAFILRESVVQLFSEEVTGRVSVTEDEIRQYYNEEFRKFIFGVIELSTEDRADRVRDLLASGDDFQSLSDEYSLTKLKDSTTEMEYRNMKPFMKDILLDLDEGEISGIHNIDDRYYIVKLFSRHEASEEGLDNARERIKSSIISQKTKERSDEYLMELRNKAGVIIDNAILSEIVLVNDTADRQQWADDERLIVTGADMTLAVKDLVKMLPARPIVSIEKVVRNWVDRKLVDIEALSRNYATQPVLRESVKRYKNQLVKNSFINRVLAPQIEVSEKEMMDYYEVHQSEFLKPVQYRIQQITVNTETEGDDVIQNLQQGGDFAWIAKKMSQDDTSELGGMLGWVTEDKLPREAREAVSALEAGEVSPVLKVGDFYRIYRVQNKTEGAVKEFNEVKPLIYREVAMDKYTKLYKQYIDGLKKEAEITVYDQEVEEVRQMFKQ